ncbi:Prophage integrase IntA [Methylophilaceae bacterium]|nr:Prophage integrase IntA [Methylophilaceae bacterium]
MYFEHGTTYRHSCKTENKLEAYEKAKIFYEQIILKKYQHPSHLQKHPACLDSNLARLAKTGADHFEKVAADWLERKTPLWSKHHATEVERRLVNNLLPYLAKKRFASIKAQDLLAIIQKIEARKAYNIAHRALSDCRQLWRYAIATGICKHDITIGLSVALHPHTTVHQKAIGIEEIPELMTAIEKYDERGDEITKYALQLLAMTFVRKSELIYAKWNEIDWERALWRIPAERMKMRIEHIVPLSVQAIQKLKRLKPLSNHSEYIFKGRLPDMPIHSNRLLEALYSLGYKGRMTAHGFRALASTVLNEHGFRPDAIERQLAHCEPNEIRRAYNRANYMDERIKMMQWWSDYLENSIKN